jgi:hypothetical protein
MNRDYTFVRPLVAAPSIFHTSLLPFYLDEKILDKEVMGWSRFTNENKISVITYSLPPISQWLAPVQTPGTSPISTKRDRASLISKEEAEKG